MEFEPTAVFKRKPSIDPVIPFFHLLLNARNGNVFHAHSLCKQAEKYAQGKKALMMKAKSYAIGSKYCSCPHGENRVIHTPLRKNEGLLGLVGKVTSLVLFLIPRTKTCKKRKHRADEKKHELSALRHTLSPFRYILSTRVLAIYPCVPQLSSSY